MQVLDSLQQLGYSSINIVLVFLVVMVVIHRAFRKFLSGQIARALYFAIGAAAFVFTVNYLADVNAAMTDAYKTKRATEQTNSN